MLLRTYLPSAPLSEFVEFIWDYENGGAQHAKERVLPTGSAGLIINLTTDSLRVYHREDASRFDVHPGCLISGPHSQFEVIDSMSHQELMGVQFKPGGAVPFLGLPASEMHNRSLSLDLLWGAGAGELRERLLETACADERFRIIERCLIGRARQAGARHPTVAFALKQFQYPSDSRPVSRVVDQVGFSPRRFIALFSEQVGLQPKLYCRVERFQRALQSIYRAGPEIDWAALASGCGYFDQAHFIKDFRTFSGLNPTAYLARRGEHQNHIPFPAR